MNQIISGIYVKTKEFKFPDLKNELELTESWEDLFVEVELNIERIQEYCDIITSSDEESTLLKDLNIVLKMHSMEKIILDDNFYSTNPFVGRNSELHNLARPNYFINTYALLSQLRGSC